MSVRPLALYLPQFHPISENDEWWGKGFTEWTNVTKAKPLYKNHWQPRLPSDLGFYDLRVPEVREAQAMLARQFGIYGFCYWHYWFAGKRIIERPFLEIVESGQPDFPFCVAWANQTWTGTWHGLSNKEILIEQTYPGTDDNTSHFYSLLKAFQDKRYIEVNGKKLVFIFQPLDLPSPCDFINTWQELAIKEGLKGIHFVGMHMPHDWKANDFGYDAMVESWLTKERYKKISLSEKFKKRFLAGKLRFLNKGNKKLPEIISYRQYVHHYPEHSLKNNAYPLVYTDWDNTPRTGKDGWLFEDVSPELFGELCSKAFKETENKAEEEKIVIIKSWNEWAEGNYLEPDNKYGNAYLEEFKKSLSKYTSNN